MLIESFLVNDPEQYGRYRFTLAHELAHWILHRHLYKGTGIAAATYDTDKHYNDSVEWQANYLAKAILMPVGQLKRAFHGMDGSVKRKVANLASIFEVSKQAMEIRLRELRMI
jgi:Zn-dependent peptidase ImmA (M78 family)